MSEIVTTCTMDLTESTLAELREFVYSTADTLPDNAIVTVRTVGEERPTFSPLRTVPASVGG